MDVERYFATGGDARYTAQDIFTNRVSEIAAFDAALDDHEPRDALSRVLDVRAPRNNVLTYYGIGGIGKSRLSRELEARLAARASEMYATCRCDFEDSGNLEIDTILLALRAALASQKPRWPAFDLGFGAYWERAHPGLPLQEVVNRSSRLRALAGRLDLGNQMKDAIESILGSPGGLLGIFVAGTRTLGTSVREHIRARQVLRECPFFDAVVQEDDVLQMRTFLPALLAWDLARVQDSEPETLRLVVFLDTWEKVQQDEARRGGFEDVVSSLAFLMPNVLFVVTGRDRLRWADEDMAAALRWGGPRWWPGLAAGSVSQTRQHLVGDLSDEDADRYLRTRLVESDQPAIPEPVRAAIVRGAQGVPLYLDLSATRFDQIITSGLAPDPADFGQPLEEVTLRVMKDLPSDQRTLLRVASLVHRFDEDLLRAAARDVGDAAIRRFVGRAFVQHHSDGAPLSLHDCLRETVRPADVSADRWSDREWRNAARALLIELARRGEPELRRTGALESATVAELFADAWRLAVITGEAPDWLYVLAAKLQSRAMLELLAWVPTATPSDNALRHAACGIAAIGERVHLGPAGTAERLREALEHPELSPAARDFLSIWLAWQLEGLGDRRGADRLREDIALGDGVFAFAARHAVGRNDWVQGRLRRALDWQFDETDPAQRAHRLGIHSRVAWILGRFAEAEDLARERVRAAETTRSTEAVAHALRTVGEIVCWSRPDRADPESQEAIELYIRLGNRVSRGEAVVAAVVRRIAIDAPPDEMLEQIQIGRTLMNGGRYADVAETCLWCVHGDADRAIDARARVLSRPDQTSYAFWDAITGWWIAELSGIEDEVPNDGRIDWIDGLQDARRRWTEVLRLRRV